MNNSHNTDSEPSSNSVSHPDDGIHKNLEVYTADTPVKQPDQDHFQRWPFAQRVARVIATRQDPSSIVISINGAWGEGKSTVLNFIEYELKQHNHVVCFRFNPWRFPDESTLLTNFFTSLANAVDKSVSSAKERVGDLIGKFGTPIASLIGHGDTAKAFGELLASVDIEELRSRVETILKEAGKRVVVLMDDIDRLDKEEIQAIFRLVKLSADFDYTAYVLAFDDNMVAAALQERYNERDPEAGRNFLEKIVQVPLNLPKISVTSLREYCFRNMEQTLQEVELDFSEQQAQTFVRHFISGLEIRLYTPRMAKRYGNILAFSLPILKGEVNPVDLMLIEGIRVFYPRLYNTIRDYPEVFLGQRFGENWGDNKHKERSLQLINSSLEELKDEEKQAARSLLSTLFPQISYLFGGSHYGSDWESHWAARQHIASRSYFSRYFSYSIPKDEVSDQELTLFLKKLDTWSVEEISRKMAKLVETTNADNFLAKLRPQSPNISPEASRKLAKATSSSGELFPNQQQAFSFLGPFSQAAMLISNLLENISDESERMGFTSDLLREAGPITFALEIFRWLPDSDKGKISFSQEQKQVLGAVVAKRIGELAQEQSLFKLFSDKSIGLLILWARLGSKIETTRYIERMLDSGELTIKQLLNTFVPNSWNLSTGSPFKGDFERTEYDALAVVIDPVLIYQRLDKSYTDNLDVEVYPRAYPVDREEEIFQQFAWIHQKVLANQTNQNGSENQPSNTEPKSDN